MDLNLVGMIFGVPPAIISFIPKENIVEGTVIDSTNIFNPSLTWTAGALVSNAHDMATFMKALLSGQLLTLDTIEMMKPTKELMILGEPVQYGIGLQIRPTNFGDALGHGGLNFGYQAGTYMVADHGITFSHMHNYLPEQSDLFQNDMLDILVNGVQDEPSVCTPPEGFFDDPEEGMLLARFKGPVNGAEVVTPVAGIGNVKEFNNGTLVPYYGLGTQAKLTTTGLQTRLEVSSLAPGTSTDGEVVAVSFSFDPAWLDAIAGDGDAETVTADDSAVFVTMATIDLIDGTLTPSKMCFTAVRDMTRHSIVHLCDADEFSPDPDATLKMFAKVPVTDDPTVVSTTLKALFLPDCLCYTEATATWGMCEQP
jgi:hypothetical protein